MKTLRLARDGQGNPRLESLALPFVAQGPTATDLDRERAPAATTTSAVRHVRAVSAPADVVEVVSGNCARRLLLVVSRCLVVTVPHTGATIGAGDVLFVDVPEALTVAADVIAAAPSTYLEVEVGAGWLPLGLVPPTLEEGQRSARTEPRVLRLTSDGERAHLTAFHELFAEPSAPAQDVEGLSFVCLSPSMSSDWHTEPEVTLLVVLVGGFEVEVGGDGGRRTLRAGDVCLVEDFEGHGHRSSMDGETRFAALKLPRDHNWSRDADTGRIQA